MRIRRKEPALDEEPIHCVISASGCACGHRHHARESTLGGGYRQDRAHFLAIRRGCTYPGCPCDEFERIGVSVFSNAEYDGLVEPGQVIERAPGLPWLKGKP